MSTLFVLLDQAAKAAQQKLPETPLDGAYNVLLQYGAIGACLVIFVILYIAGIRYQQKLHKETVELVKADTDQTRVAYLVTSAVLSVLPLALLGGFLLWLRRQYRRQRNAAAPPLPH